MCRHRARTDATRCAYSRDNRIRSNYQVYELLSDARYLWHGARDYLVLDPAVVRAHIFRVRRRIRTERNFDHFM